MQLTEVGVDIEETKRFSKLRSSSSLIKMVFTQSEIDYCFRYKDFWTHLAARFAAKEAVQKALFGFNINNLSMKDIEIILNRGRPGVRIESSSLKNIVIKLTMSHTKDIAISFVIAYKTR